MSELHNTREGKIQNDIDLIFGIFQAADLRDSSIRMKIFNEILQNNFFESQLGILFLESLLNDGLYDNPAVPATIKKDLTDLKRIVKYTAERHDVRVTRYLLRYRFQNTWIQEFASNYLKGSDMEDRLNENYLAEAADLRKIRNLLRKGHAHGSFQHDSIYKVLKKYDGQPLFGTWVGNSFIEAVGTESNAYQQKKRLASRFRILGWVCILLAVFLIFWGLHIKEQERTDRNLQQHLQGQGQTESIHCNTQMERIYCKNS